MLRPDIALFRRVLILFDIAVSPGLTGLWQVSGRNNIDFDEWMALDLRYIDTWSLWLDLKILLRTPLAVINKTGAS